MAEMVILGVIQGLSPYLNRMIALLVSIQKDLAETKAMRK